jgi:hypothetical protein
MTTTTSNAPVTPPTPPELPADLAAGLRRLKLAAIRHTAPEVLQTAKTQRWTPHELLRVLVDAELTARDASNAANRLKAAAFPVTKTLDGLDLTASTIPAATLDYLAGLDWIRSHGEPRPDRAARHRQKPHPDRPRPRRRHRRLPRQVLHRSRSRRNPLPRHRRQLRRPHHRHPAPQRPDHLRRSRLRTPGRHRHPTPVPPRRRRLRTTLTRGRLTLAVRPMGPTPARTHHRSQHPGPPAAPRHRHRHHRRVLPHARRTTPPQGGNPRPTEHPRRGGDLHLATNGDHELAVDTSAGRICLSSRSRYARSVDGLKPAPSTCAHRASASSLTRLSWVRNPPVGPGLARSRIASARAFRAAASDLLVRRTGRVAPS